MSLDFEEPYFEVLPGPDCEQAKALYVYWQQHHVSEDGKDSTLPKRDDISLPDLVALGCADRAFIMEPVGEDDWQYRLLGSEIVRYFGRDVTGIPFRQHMLECEAETAIRISNEAAQTRKPVFLKMRFISGDHSGLIETMSLPILARDETTIWLFGATFFPESE